MNERKTLWRIIGERRKIWFQHKMRNNESITTIMEDKTKGKAGEVDQAFRL